MAHPRLRSYELPSTQEGREIKRRKTRKGTQSCWECKRRKTKCHFTVSTKDATCDGCKRRGTQCVSQEFPENPASNRQQLGDRLGRVEELVDRLAQNTGGASVRNARSTSPPAHGQHGCPKGHSSGFTVNGLAPESSQSSTYLVNLSEPGQEKPSMIKLDQLTQCITVPSPLPFSRSHSARLEEALMTAWPSQSDLELILSVPVSSLGLFHGMVCMPCSRFVHQRLPSPRKLLQTPAPGSHPVLIARKLLTLVSFLQSLTPVATKQLAGRMSARQQDIMLGAVEVASRLVNSNDDLVGTVEGVECVMMESMYHNNAGNLRRAYIAMRRALVIAQMVGLNQGPNSPLLRVLELDTRKRISPEYMWFRIVQSDRYLSLMLGLPQGSADDGFAAPHIMQECTATERMERILTLAAGQIIQRNSSEMYDLEVTQDIDRLLLDGAASQPPQWWLPPDLARTEDEELRSLDDTTQIMTQFTHYHILGQLHLPYLLHPSIDRVYDFNRLAAVAASREVLLRFVSFRSSRFEAASFCRGVDFLAFIASTVLCLGHIHCRLRHHDQTRGGDSQADSSVFSCLAHQRLSDRGIMERVLECMEDVARITPTDPIAPKVASILRHLLVVEADVANGDCYRTDTSHGENEELGCNGNMSDDGMLRIHLPHLGTVKIRRTDITKSGLRRPISTEEGIATVSGLSGDSLGPVVSFESAMQRDSHQVATGHVAARCTGKLPFSASPARPSGTFECPSESDQDGLLAVTTTGLDDDWDLQGVDLAFFGSLFPGHGEGL